MKHYITWIKEPHQKEGNLRIGKTKTQTVMAVMCVFFSSNSQIQPASPASPPSTAPPAKAGRHTHTHTNTHRPPPLAKHKKLLTYAAPIPGHKARHTAARLIYKHALLLHKVFNDEDRTARWLSLHFQQNFNRRLSKFQIHSNHKFRVSKNLVANRLTIIN